jgi:anti-sigma factor RsiW
MTSDHVQDLLLDLAYGELPPDRAAEVEAHLASCEVCRTERDELVRTRALVAPLRSLEEPRPGFDERIVKSARAEAGLQADGTPGPTIEVSGSVKPLGLQAGRVDPLAPGVRVAKKEISKRTLWRKRATVGASIASAAAVALIVASSVQQSRVDRSTEVPELKVRAPAMVAPSDKTGAAQAQGPAAAARRGSGGDLAPQTTASPPPPAALAERSRKPEEGKSAERPAAKDQHADVAFKKAAPPPASPPPAAAAPPQSNRDSLEPASRSVATVPLGAGARADETRALAKEREQGTVASGAPVPAASPPAQENAASAAISVEQAPDPDRLEESAGEARRAGSYPRAAELYQLAAGLRRAKNDSSRAAWDLAHAVECLAAGSKLREATDVRAELMRSYPAEDGPLRAADRALGWPGKAGR